MENQALHPVPTAVPPSKTHQVPVAVNEMRLSAGQWAAVAAIFVLVAMGVPKLWKKVERFETGPDYRIPYSLSKDYWLYQRRLADRTTRSQVVLLGDSVVWGEYVLPNGTLSHFLNQEAGTRDKFVNGGVNGLFPLALEGLIRCYGQPLRHRKVLLQANVLWMSSPKVDLQTPKEEKFNHSRLVPQFSPRIPCYKADASERIGAVMERNVPCLSWVGHLQAAYFEEKSLLNWTLDPGEGDPPSYPNAYKNPLAQITMSVPSAPANDPQRGPSSPRHKAWSVEGSGPVAFDWVRLDTSLQWGAFRRLVQLLQQRGNEVLVVLGPFNEHMIAEESKPAYRKLRDGIATWLTEQQIPHLLPEVLPSPLYADASHPLTDGYALLAHQLYANRRFQDWLTKP